MRDSCRNMRPHLPVAGLFALLAVLMTWPMVLHMRMAFPSFELWFGGDPNMYVWLIDWTAKALTGALPVPAAQMLFFPGGIDTFGGYDGALMLAFALPVRLLSGSPVLAYDLFILAALWSGALAAYTLAFREMRSRGLAAVAGLAFGFSPYAMVRAGQHPNLLMLGVLPLLAVASIAFTERPTVRRGGPLAAAMLLTALSSWYYAVGGIIFLAVGLLSERRAFAGRWRTVAITAALVAAATALPALPMLLSGSHGGIPEDPAFVASLGMQPANLVLPHPFTNMLGSATATVYEGFPRIMVTNPNLIESTSYLGILLVLALLALAIPSVRSRLPHWKCWAWELAAFSVLALGTELRVGGTAVPMPFALLRTIPPFSLIRAPNRLFAFALLAATMLALPAIAAGADRIAGRRRRAAFIAAIAAFLLMERVMLPFPLFTPEPSEFHRTLAAAPSAEAIADIPIMNPGISLYDTYQITHGRPIVDGEYFYPAYGDDTFSFIRGTPLLDAMVCDDTPPALPTGEDRTHTWERLRNAGVGHVVVHNLIIRNVPLCADTYGYLRAFFAGETPEFSDGAITAYAVPSADDSDRPAGVE